MSTIASGLKLPFGLAFDNGGNLFVSEPLGHDILEITPGGAPRVFAAGNYVPYGIAFEPQVVPEPSTVGLLGLGLGALLV